MFHAQIAQRAFNTPLLIEPSNAMAFLSGLGPRITGRQLRLAGIEVAPEAMAHAALPVRAGILTNGLADQYRGDGQMPFATVDGIAVIEVSGGCCQTNANSSLFPSLGDALGRKETAPLGESDGAV